MCSASERDAEVALPLSPPISNSHAETQPLLPNSVKLPYVATQRDTHSSSAHSELYGFFLLGLSTLGFSGMSFLIHMAESNYHIATSSCVFLRGSVQWLLSMIYIVRFLDLGAMLRNLSRKQKNLLALRGLVGSLSLVTFIKALELLPLGIAISLFFISPVMGIALSYFTLGEPISPLDCVASVVSLVGVVCISQPSANDLNSVTSTQGAYILGTICALASAFLASTAYCVLRSLGTGIHFITSVLVFGSASTVVGVLLGGTMSPAEIVANKEGVCIVIISSLFAFGGQCLMTKGLQHCRVGPGMLVRNLDVPLGYIFGLVFLSEKVSMLSLFGSSLVLFSAVLIGVHKAMNS